MLKTVIVITVFFIILIVTGIITKKSVVNQYNEELKKLEENQFEYTLGSNYTYRNSDVEKVISMDGEKEISVQIWTFNVLGDISIILFDSDGNVYMEREGKNMEYSLTFKLGKGSYLLGVRCNHVLLGSYVLGFKNIDDLYAPVSMDSGGKAESVPQENFLLFW